MNFEFEKNGDSGLLTLYGEIDPAYVDDIKDFKEDSIDMLSRIEYRYAIGHRVREVRGLLGLSQKEFGRQIGLSYQHVSKYERGLIMPGVEVLVKIYECFKVNINWLLTGKGPTFLEGHKISLEEDLKSKESIPKWIEIFWNTSTHDKKNMVHNRIPAPFPESLR